MKTTVELPDALFRQAGALAATRGVTLRRFLTDAVEEQIRRCSHEDRAGDAEPPWMVGFGALSDLSDESCRVLASIEAEFEMFPSEGGA
ncbi:MAG: hypothetical protein F4027_11685 [Rhodospirillaceae bacterium]|nr:hypothetical protein [Rhodospirillaceae bacterium]MYF85290.1 hypothetical protein [Rhodospirillaceae bacterium]MYH35330.1 hypothetical protein [Rhodospirillaceae bacterium]MYK16000.1 hypothetical protein [Rhodospirillaceae bacterium]MYK59216.1 hypothetical protein [Rhodospirillaceae bacterium]